MKDAEIYGKSALGNLYNLRVTESGEAVVVFGGDATPTVLVAGSTGTTVVVGDVDSDVADNESAPVKVGGIARTTNPTAVTDGDRVSASYDALGRQLVTPYQVRSLVSTAYAVLSNGSETTLLAGSAGVFLDLVTVTFANTSSAALGAATDVNINIRDATGGGIIASVVIQDQDTKTISFPVPIPQNTAGGSWTLQMDDVTGTVVNVSAIFTKNV